MPHIDTVRQWLIDKKEFSAHYAHARELQADVCADNIYAIANEKPERIPISEGVSRIDPAHVNDKRLRCDAEKWRASKLAPKKYGDRVGQEESNRPDNRLEVVIRGVAGSQVGIVVSENNEKEVEGAVLSQSQPP